MEVIAKFEPNVLTENKLKRIPDEVLFSIAKQTLDFSIPHIPMSNEKNHSGTLRRTSGRGANGVHECLGGYFIGSYTDYASHVWTMNDSTTNWTTSDTHSQWYAWTLKRYGKVIIENAVNEVWKDEF